MLIIKLLDISLECQLPQCVESVGRGQAIVRVLLHKYIHIPADSALSAVLGGFARKGFPQCAGAIDGCHIPIEAPQQCSLPQSGILSFYKE